MQKPITLLISDFRKNMDDVINNSKLPWWKIKDELEFLILPQVKQCAILEEQAERREYQKMLKGEERQKLEELREKRVTESEVNEIEENKVSESEVDNNG